MATSLSICNSALIKLGAETITSLSDNNKRAKLCNTQYETIKKKVLRAHPWNFAIKRAKLVANTDIPEWEYFSAFTLPTDCLRVINTMGCNDFAIEGNALMSKEGFTEIQAGEVEAGTTDTILNVTGHLSLVGDIISINDERRVVDSITANTITLAEALSGTPSTGDDFTDYRAADIYIRYIANISEDEFTDDFAEALSHYIAYELAYALVQNKELRNENFQLYQEMVRETRSFDAQEGTPEDFIVDTFTAARL